MEYALGIDVGTSFTAAAVCRRDGELWGAAEAVGLGTRSTATASVVFLGDDGTWLVGDAADRRAHIEPNRVIREFKRRLGDPVPIVVDGQRQRPEAIAATVVHWVIGRIAEQEGGPPAAITITHPASWGPYKLSLFEKAIADVIPTPAAFVSEPVAAAAHYASLGRIDPGSAVAVYDLGGGTFDAAVVRKSSDGSFELLGTPQGIDRLGGMDFDEAVFGHLRAGTGLPAADPEDPDAVSAMIRLRRECTEAKEALSDDTETTIPVLLPQVNARVRLVRAEFEELIHDAIEQTVEALRMTVESADLALSDIDAVLLVGGSSRVPLVAQLISAQLDRPVVVDADPKAAIALGAAVLASAKLDALTALTLDEGEPPILGVNASGGAPGAAPIGRPSRRKVRVLSGAAALAIAIAGASAVAVVWPPASTESGRSAVGADTTPPRDTSPNGDAPTERTRPSTTTVSSTTGPLPPGTPLLPSRDSPARPATTPEVASNPRVRPSPGSPAAGSTGRAARSSSRPAAPPATATAPRTPGTNAPSSSATAVSPTTIASPSDASGPTSDEATTPATLATTPPPAPATTASSPAPEPEPTTASAPPGPASTVAPATPPPVVDTEPPPTAAATPATEPPAPPDAPADPPAPPDPASSSAEPAADAAPEDATDVGGAEAPTDEGSEEGTPSPDGPV